MTSWLPGQGCWNQESYALRHSTHHWQQHRSYETALRKPNNGRDIYSVKENCNIKFFCHAGYLSSWPATESSPKADHYILAFVFMWVKKITSFKISLGQYSCKTAIICQNTLPKAILSLYWVYHHIPHVEFTHFCLHWCRKKQVFAFCHY